jgi:NADH dehydrogenase
MAGRAVRALARPTADPERLKTLAQSGVEIVFGDLKQPGTLKAACQGVDGIIATASSTLSRQENDSIDTVDREGYLTLIDVALEAGVHRLVYATIPPNLHDSPLTRAKAEVARQLMASGMEYTLLAANYFMEVWLSPALGFDVANGRITIYGNGDRPIGFVSYKDVAEVAVRSLASDTCKDKTIAVAGPANLTPLEVVRIFEQLSGRHLQVEHVPENALWEKWRNAIDPLDKTFAGLMLDYALGCTMDIEETLSILPMHLISVQDYAASMFRG